MYKAITLRNAVDQALCGKKGIVVTTVHDFKDLPISELLSYEAAGAKFLIEEEEPLPVPVPKAVPPARAPYHHGLVEDVEADETGSPPLKIPVPEPIWENRLANLGGNRK